MKEDLPSDGPWFLHRFYGCTGSRARRSRKAPCVQATNQLTGNSIREPASQPLSGGMHPTECWSRPVRVSR
jgi:hypothetical protein